MFHFRMYTVETWITCFYSSPSFLFHCPQQPDLFVYNIVRRKEKINMIFVLKYRFDSYRKYSIRNEYTQHLSWDSREHWFYIFFPRTWIPIQHDIILHVCFIRVFIYARVYWAEQQMKEKIHACSIYIFFIDW